MLVYPYLLTILAEEEELEIQHVLMDQCIFFTWMILQPEIGRRRGSNPELDVIFSSENP